MKILVASDIHGSAYYAEKLIEAFRTEKADKLIICGDIYYHGPRNPFPKDYDPMKVADLLGRVRDRLIVVRGNCDSEVDEMISPFPFFNDHTEPLGTRKIFFSHGHIYNERNIPAFLDSGDILCFGHYHFPMNEKTKAGITILNPGSVSLPKNDKHTYAVITEDDIFIKNIS